MKTSSLVEELYESVVAKGGNGSQWLVSFVENLLGDKLLEDAARIDSFGFRLHIMYVV